MRSSSSCVLLSTLLGVSALALCYALLLRTRHRRRRERDARVVLVTLGNPMLDVVVPLRAILRHRHVASAIVVGKKVHDVIDVTSSMRERLLACALAEPDVNVSAGGSALNVARSAAFLLQPLSVVAVGSIGADVEGSTLLEETTRANVRPVFQRTQAATTRCVSLIAEDGERSMVSVGNSHKQLEWDAISSSLGDIRPLVLFISGFALSLPLGRFNVACELALHQQKHHNIVSLSLASTVMIASSRSRMLALMRLSSIVFAEKRELLAWSKNEEDVTCAARLVIRQMSSSSAKLVVVTAGTDPTVAVDGDGTVYTVAVRALPVVDTVGAGDSFAGGFLARLISYLRNGEAPSWTECIEAGHQMAAIVIQQHGCRIPQQ